MVREVIRHANAIRRTPFWRGLYDGREDKAINEFARCLEFDRYINALGNATLAGVGIALIMGSCGSTTDVVFASDKKGSYINDSDEHPTDEEATLLLTFWISVNRNQVNEYATLIFHDAASNEMLRGHFAFRNVSMGSLRGNSLFRTHVSFHQR